VELTAVPADEPPAATSVTFTFLVRFMVPPTRA
jgi:hypothetical protein